MKPSFKLRSLFSIMLLVLLGITLSACKNASSKYPSENIGDNVILSINHSVKNSAGNEVKVDVNVTEKELYDRFRRYDANVLNRMAEKILLAEQIAKINLDNDKHKEYLTEQLNETLFKEKKAKKVQYKSENELYTSLMKFVGDKNYASDYAVNELKEYVLGEIAKNAADRNFENYPANCLKLHEVKLAKRIYAYDRLTELSKIEKEKDHYIKVDENTLSRFQNNNLKEVGMSFFAIDFVNEDELNTLLRENGATYSTIGNVHTKTAGHPIKMNTSTGEFFEVPDIRQGAIDFNLPEYKYLKDYIEKQLLNKVFNKEIFKTIEDVKTNFKKITDKEFQSYISTYPINKTRTNGERSDIPLTKTEVLNLFISLYNKLHSEPIHLEGTQTLKYANGDIFKTDYDKKEIKEHLLKEILTNTLVFNYEVNGTDLKEDKSKFYTGQLTKAFGNRKFLVYKFSESANDRQELAKVYDFDKKVFKSDAPSKEAVDNIKKILVEEILESKLVDTFIDGQFKDLVKNKKINIYDPIVRVSFDRAKKEYNTKSTYKDNAVLLEIDGKTITARQYYDEMYKIYGIKEAVYALYSKFIRVTEIRELTQEALKKADSTLKLKIQKFTSGQGEYEAKIGRDLFLKHAFGADNYNDALDVEKENEARKVFLQDIASKIDGYYDNLHSLATSIYDKRFSGTFSHVLISVDEDYDGNPDNPLTLRQSRIQEIENNYGLISRIIKQESEKSSKELGKALETLIKEYTDSVHRVVKTEAQINDNKEYYAYANSIHSQLTLAKKLNVNLKYESLNKITDADYKKFDAHFFARLVDFTATFREKLATDKAIEYPQVDSIDIIGFDAKKIRSSFGWHTLILNELSKPLDAKQDKEYLSDAKDKDGNKYNVPANLPTGDKKYCVVSKEQIKVYLIESESARYKVNIPNHTNIKAQLEPITTLLSEAKEFGVSLLLHILDGKITAANDTYKGEYNTFVDDTLTNVNGLNKYNFNHNQFWFGSNDEGSIANKLGLKINKLA